MFGEMNLGILGVSVAASTGAKRARHVQRHTFCELHQMIIFHLPV